MSVSIDRLREVLAYDPSTGLFRWTVGAGRGGRKRPGAVAGNPDSSGHIQIGIDGRRYLAHRLAWLWVYGEWPIHQVDHLNGMRTDNRIANLRQLTNQQNAQNSTCLRRSNTSGFPGVSARGRRWSAQIMVDRRIHRLGCFATPEEAHEAYLAAKRRLHPFWNEVVA